MSELYGFKKNLEKVQVRSKADSVAKASLVPTKIATVNLAAPTTRYQYAQMSVPDLANWNTVVLTCRCGNIAQNLIFFRAVNTEVFLIDALTDTVTRAGYTVDWANNRILIRWTDGNASLIQNAVRIWEVYGIVQNVDVVDSDTDDDPSEDEEEIDITALTEEVQGIRIGADGTIYDTAGDAVRGQYEQLAQILDALDVDSASETIQGMIDDVQDAVDLAIEQIEQSGGLILDNTLTHAGEAADAKATGDAITDLREDITELQNGGYVADQQQIEVKINTWLNEHPEATTTVQDGSITDAKLSAKLKFLTTLDLNSLSYHENIALPIETSYVEAITYMDSYYYVVCRNYSDNTCYIAKYDADFNFVTSVYTNSTYGIANNICNDGTHIYVDYDNGYHVKFDTSITMALAVQNTTIRNLAYWNSTLYGIYIDTSTVTVYEVESDLVTKTELFSINTTRYTLQSASIIDGILFIPTTKGMFKFIDMETHSMIAEVPYYDTKEIESFFEDADGAIKCCGHFYGLNGIFNIGTFDGGVDGAKMQYSDIDGSNGDFSAFARQSFRYGFYHITNGTDMGLPADEGDLMLFEQARLYISTTGNAIYAYKSNAWKLINLITPIRVDVTVNSSYTVYIYATVDGHLFVRCETVALTNKTTSVSIDLSDIYTALGIGSARSFTFYTTGITMNTNITGSSSELYMAQIVLSRTALEFYVRNITQNSVENINAKFAFYVQII